MASATEETKSEVSVESSPSKSSISSGETGSANETPQPTPQIKKVPPSITRRHLGKAPEILVYERKNWLIHFYYIHKDYEACRSLTTEVIAESEGACEYALYVQALMLREEGDIQKALELFEKCQHINKENVNNWKQVARSLFLLGRHKHALNMYNDAAKMAPKDWEIVHNMGVCCYNYGDVKQAKAYFNQALALTRHDCSYLMLGKCFLKANDLEGATQVFQKAFEFSPENPEFMTTLGLLYLKLNEQQKAFDKLGNALVYDPSNVKAVLGIGAMIQSKEEFEVAQTKYKIACHQIPMSPFLWNNIAMCFFGKRKNVAAVSCLKRAAYLAPFEWTIQYNLGLVHLTIEQYASAFHFLKAGLTLVKNKELYSLMAVTLTRLNALEDAKKAYEQAINLQKDDAPLYLDYALLLNQMDDRRAAAKQLQIFNKIKVQDQNLVDTANRLAAVLQVGKLYNGATEQAV